MLVIGASAAAIDATVTTEPEDALDIDYRPLTHAVAAQLPDEADDTTTEAQDSAEEGEPEEDGTNAPKHRGQTDPEVGEEARESAPEEGGDAEDESILSPLLSSLRYVLPALALLALGALVVRARGLVSGGTGVHPDPPRDARSRQIPMPSRDMDAVEAAWVELIAAAEPSQHDSLTTAELAREAIDNGHDPDAVWQITRIFDEVTYGNASVTDEREKLARESVRQLRGTEAKP